MLKLMKLEMQKFEITKYVKGALIANIVILFLICLIAYVETNQGIQVMTSHYMAMEIIETIIRVTFIIFAAVLLSQIVISEYKNKTINVLFMYPIKRRTILIAKLLVTVLFTFFAIIFSFIIVGSGFYLFNSFTNVIPEPLSATIIINSFGKVVFNALAASLISLIPLYFGLKKYSVPATIVSAFFVSLIISQNINGFSLYSIIIIPITLSLIGLATAIIAIKNIDNGDIIT
ncbi:ABC transporter permease [Cytobacillus kochii]|nr:ABC transporter permease [Cytobacillus kochii]MDQ0186284.1 ABC-type transport system involved in multi-copper enzyme maturation permease subunit [Cytobacillus kochii]